MATKSQRQKQDEAGTNLNIDLTSLPVTALKSLRSDIDELLRQSYIDDTDDNDIVLEYDIKIHTADGDVKRNKGVTRMNKITSPRLIVDAPRRFEAEFLHQVYEPVYADAMEIFDSKSGSNKSLLTIKQNIGEYDDSALPGLPGSE